MAEPTSTQISAEIQKIVKRTYAQEPSQLTVNNVRKTTAQNLDLEEDFFQSGDWKLRSKELIKRYIEELEAEGEEEEEEKGEAEEPAPPAPTKGKKRTSSASEKSAPRKRQKKHATPVDAGEPMDEAETEHSESIHDASTKSKPKSKSPAIKAGDESEMSDVHDEAPKPKQVRKTKSKSKSTAVKAADESEMSDVQDEAPKSKQIRRTKSEMAASKDLPKTKTSSKSKSTTKSKVPAKSKFASTDLSPDEAEIKTLQSHLVKCGIRKLWGVLLKPYGDDSKAKIKCLKDMLKEAGMTGRFSNERAAQIKEARELADEVEAVNEGAEKWGLEGGRKRLSRGQPSSKQRVLGSVDEDDNEMAREKGSSSEPTDRKQADAFAFLGDEESE